MNQIVNFDGAAFQELLAPLVAELTAAKVAADNAVALINREVLLSLAELQGYARDSGVGSVTIAYGSTPGDGRGGEFAYDSTDVASPDNGYSVIVGSDGARWKRVEDRAWFDTRSEVGTLLSAGWVPKVGRIYSIGRHFFSASPGSTAIADLPGFVPAGIPSLGHFASVINGLADNGPHLGALIDYLIDSSDEYGHLPGGDIIIDTPVTRTFAGHVDIPLRGAGRSATRLKVTSAGGGILLTSTQQTSTIDISDFSIVTDLADAGTALSFTVPEGGAEQERRAMVRNVFIGSTTYNNSLGGFKNGLILEGMFRPHLSNVTISRGYDFAGKMEKGISVDKTFRADLEMCEVNVEAVYGFSDQGASGEGGYYTRCMVNRADYGIYRDRTVRKPELHINHCHLNCKVANVVLDGVKQLMAYGNLLYCPSGADANHVDWDIRDCRGARIIATEYHNYHASNRTHIRMDPSLSNNAGAQITDIVIAHDLLAATAAKYVTATADVENLEIFQSPFENTEQNTSYPADIYDIQSTSAIVHRGADKIYFGSDPRMNLIRHSTGAAGMVLPELNFSGLSDADVQRNFGTVRTVITAAANGAESGEVQIQARRGGALGAEASFGNGVGIGSESPKGVGTLAVDEGYYVGATRITGRNGAPIIPDYAMSQVESAASGLNATYKQTGMKIWERTNKRYLRASGSGPTDPWEQEGGATVVPE